MGGGGFAIGASQEYSSIGRGGGGGVLMVVGWRAEEKYAKRLGLFIHDSGGLL